MVPTDSGVVDLGESLQMLVGQVYWFRAAALLLQNGDADAKCTVELQGYSFHVLFTRRHSRVLVYLVV